MKFCYKNFCITGTSILSGIVLSLIFMIVYSKERILVLNYNKDKN
jgi:hypothetical protein